MTVYRIRGLAMLMAGSATLTACASIPDLPPPAQARDPAQIASSASFADDSGEWPAAGWWSAYGDPQLSRLMEEAIAGSPDLKVAQARLAAAQGYAQQAGAALLPTVDMSASSGLVQQSENNGIPPALVPNGWTDSGKVGLGFSLNLDLWGKNRASLAAANSDALAAKYEVEAAKLALTTSLAATYAELARLHAQRDVLNATEENRSESLRIVTQRVEADLDNRVALNQANSRLSLARAELSATDEAIALTRNAIAALVGKGPDRALSIAAPKVSLATLRGVPASASIRLIGRRPDIAAARAGVEASASRIKVARAAFYPDVSLSGLIGLQSLGFGNLFKAGSAYGNVGPAVTLPIFHGGALSGQYRGARGQYDEAVARYDGIILQALREVADTLVSRKMLALRVAASRDALTHAGEAYALARTRYASGLSSYLDVLSTEDGVLQARRNLADLETRAFTLDVSMVRALGGGFATN
jgi:NodT family efflux transporter outer membrane factor (OMF) lipoprotein